MCLLLSVVMYNLLVILQYPVDKPIISQKFGEDNTHTSRRDFYKVFDNMHPGVDFKLDIDTMIFASYPGIVVRSEFHEGMGNVVGIRNGNIIFLYAHLSEIVVKLGEDVGDWDHLGQSGDTGKACLEPHLHFEMRDLTKDTLKEMVFEPKFGEEIRELKQNFIYVVNNANTKKDVYFLSKKYYGSENYAQKILEANKKLNFDLDEIIPDGARVVIPNYKDP